MSLDVYLTAPDAKRPAATGIFIRENGATREISREEWDSRFPGREPVTVTDDVDDHEVYSRNITHNLGTMAGAAGIYKALWRPDENGITHAGQLVPLLEAGLTILRAEPDRFRALNPANGWGDYDGLLDFVEDYLSACRAHPDATVSVSR